MSEETKKPQEASEAEKPHVAAPVHDLAEELRKLGGQLEVAMREAFKSEEAQKIQRELLTGMQEVGKQVDHAMQTVQKDPQVQKLAERGEQALQQVQESPAAKDFQEVMNRGLAYLNAQISEFTTRIKQQSETASAEKPAEAAQTPPSASPKE